MTSSEAHRRWTQDLRWRVGLLVFAVLLAVGGGCAAWFLGELQASGARAARADAHAMAQSVAQTLARQLDRAVRLGIPLAELPGLTPYLEAALKGQPALTAIAVSAADGSALAAAGTPLTARDDAGARVAIGSPAAPAGEVVINTDSGAAVHAGLRAARAQSALAALLLAAIAGLLAALGPGARLERQRRALWAALESAPAPGAQIVTHQAHGPAAALHALAAGDARLQAQDDALSAYAHELLAVDFDGQLRQAIARIQHATGIALEPA